MAGLSLALLLVVGTLAWVVLDEDPYVAPPPDRAPPTAEPALAAEVLLDLERAVATGDADLAASLAPQEDRASRRNLAALADNARALRVQDFTLRYVDEDGAVSTDGTWSAAVDATWAFGGFDDAPARSEVGFRFVVEDGAAALADIGGADRRTPLWMDGPVEVRRTAESLVLVDGTPRAADLYGRLARRAVPDVRAVLPDRSLGLVVEVPGSVAALHDALAADDEEYGAIAAVTTTADGSLAPDAPVHVFVNPVVFAGLEPAGSQVVMSHEAVHVATDAATNSTMPLWLLEGFADYVALRDVELPTSTTAGQIIKQVRRKGPPAHLPGPQEFDTTTTQLGSAYEAAWLACRLLADVGGEDALVRFYERVNDGGVLGAALQQEFGLTRRDLTRQWQALLTDLAA
ncbi:MAG: hypothetical protein ACRDOM_05345 [Nocardioides sp.]